MSLAAVKADKNILWIGSLLFLACVFLFIYTGNYLLLAAPFAVAVLVLAIFNWKTLYWLLVLCIPFSAEISLFNGVLATTVPDEQLMWLFLGIFLLLVLRYRNIMPDWFLRHPLTLIFVLQLIWLIIAVAFSTELLPSLKYLLAKMWFWTSFIIFPVLVFREKNTLNELSYYLQYPL